MKHAKPFGNWPLLATVCWSFPARDDRPAFKMFWYEGASERPESQDIYRPHLGWTAHKPPIFTKLEKEYGQKLEHGSIFVGDKGYLHSPVYANNARTIPHERMREIPRPADVESSPGNIMTNFLAACRGEQNACSNFTVSGPYMETLLTGHLAMRAGVGQKIEWNGEAMKVNNMPHLNEFVTNTYRKGFELI